MVYKAFDKKFLLRGHGQKSYQRKINLQAVLTCARSETLATQDKSATENNYIKNYAKPIIRKLEKRKVHSHLL